MGVFPQDTTFPDHKKNLNTDIACFWLFISCKKLETLDIYHFGTYLTLSCVYIVFGKYTVSMPCAQDAVDGRFHVTDAIVEAASVCGIRLPMSLASGAVSIRPCNDGMYFCEVGILRKAHL